MSQACDPKSGDEEAFSSPSGSFQSDQQDFDDLLQVSTHQEEAVSAINRDVVELVARQKVAKCSDSSWVSS